MPRKSTPTRAQAFTAAALVALMSPAAAQAAKETSKAPAAHAAAKLLRPAAGSLSTRRRLAVKVSVPSGARNIVLRVAGRNVTGSLRGHGTIRTAAVPTAKLRAGKNLVTVRGKDVKGQAFFAHQSVTIARSAATEFRTAPTVKVVQGHAELGLDLRERPSQVKIKLNGKRVDLLRTPRAGTTTIQLAANDGLRYGSNTVRVSAVNEDTGTWARSTQAFTVGTSTPLASAGADRRVLAGATVAMSGSQSRATRRQVPLGYRWTIISQPKGANATLVGATSAKPKLKTTRPGTYKLQLALIDGTRAQAAQATTTPTAPATATATDTLTIDAAASAPPYGIPLTTFAPNPAAPDGTSYRIQTVGLPITEDGQDSTVLAGGMLDYIVLDRTTLGLETSGFLLDPAQSDLQNLLNGWTDNELVILAGDQVPGPGMTNLGPVDTTKNFTSVFVGSNQANPLVYNNGNVTDTAAGGITGVLRKATQTNGAVAFTYADTHAISFDTLKPSTSGGNQISFGAASGTVPTTGQGVSMLSVTEDLKSVAWAKQYPIVGNATADEASMSSLAVDISNSQHYHPNSVLLVQTYGKPKATTTAWGQVGQALSGFGGTPSVWDALDGTGDYALVGVAHDYADLPNAADVHAVSAAEASQVQSQESANTASAPWTGTVRGVIGRGVDGTPIIRAATSVPTITSSGQTYSATDLTPLVDSAPQAWPLSDAAHTAALSWISQQLGPKDPATQKPTGLGNPDTDTSNGWCYQPSTWDLRAEYCNNNVMGSWSGAFTDQLTALSCPTNGTGFTQGQCNDVVAELKSEFTALPIVDGFMNDLEKPYETATPQSLATTFTSASDNVVNSLSVTPPSQPFQMQELLDLVLGPLQDVDAPDGVDAFPLMMGLLNSAVDGGLGSLTDNDGNPALAAFTANKDTIAAQAADRMTGAVTGMGVMEDIIVSDPNKLMTVADNAVGPWSISGLTSQAATTAINASTQQWLYQEMLPGAYNRIEVSPKTGSALADVNNVSCLFGPYPAQYTRWPFVPGATPNLRTGSRDGGTPLQASAAFAPATGTNADGTITTSKEWTMGNPTGSQAFQQPTSTLTDPLFQTVNAGGVGLLAPQMFTWAWQGAGQVLFDTAIKEMGGSDCYTN